MSLALVVFLMIVVVGGAIYFGRDPKAPEETSRRSGGRPERETR